MEIELPTKSFADCHCVSSVCMISQGCVKPANSRVSGVFMIWCSFILLDNLIKNIGACEVIVVVATDPLSS